MKKFLLPLVFSLYAALFTSSAFAAELMMIPVGEFGGIRLKAPCTFGANQFACSLDTMGAIEGVVAIKPEFAGYRVLKKERIGGIGIGMECEVLEVRDFALLGEKPSTLKPMRCPMDHSAFPLIGLPFFEGKRFTLDFPKAAFSWELVERGAKGKIMRLGGKSTNWLGMRGKVGGVPVLATHDTGNPVTMVMRAFVTANPSLFRKSDKPIDESLKQKGMAPYELLAPLSIEGVELPAQYVYALNEFPFPEAKGVDVILGMNHMGKAAWSFDLAKDEFWVLVP